LLLTLARQKTAEQVGQYVEAQIKNLPACNAQQLASLGSIDPLNITCLPPNVNAESEATLVTQNIQDSTDFLSNPVITEDNINPSGSHQTSPYYDRFSKAPKLYKLAVKLPWIYGLVSVLSAVGIIFVAPRKRKGLKRTGIILGLILKHIEKAVFNNSSNEQIHQALVSFMTQAEDQLVKVYFLFGIAFLLLAIIIFVFLWSGGQRTPKIKAAGSSPKPTPTSGGSAIADRLRGGTRGTTQTSEKPKPKGPPKLPPRRLIQ
jgi:hypothetical protein